VAFDVLSLGTVPGDGTGDDLVTAGGKINDNFAKAVEGPASATGDRVVLFDGTTGKLVKQATFAVGDVMRLSTNQTATGQKTFDAVATFKANANFETLINLKPGTPPGSPAEGDVYFDSTDKVLKCYADGGWRDLFTLPSP